MDYNIYVVDDIIELDMNLYRFVKARFGIYFVTSNVKLYPIGMHMH